MAGLFSRFNPRRTDRSAPPSPASAQGPGPERDPSRPGAAMVREQLAARGIRDARVLEAMARLDRRLFVPEAARAQAFLDAPLPIGQGQTISQPYIVAAMTELLELEPEHRVLEIGTGSGYQAAVLSRLCAEVVSVERHRELSATAARALEAAGCRNVELIVGDGSLGWPPGAPYDRIIVTAAADSIDRPLLRQLVEGGALIAPVEEPNAKPSSEPNQRLRVWKRQGDKFPSRDLFEVRFVPLVRGVPGRN